MEDRAKYNRMPFGRCAGVAGEIMAADHKHRLLHKRSRLLSRVLRHEPQLIGLTLDEEGWADILELIDCAAHTGIRISEPLIQEIVATNDKQRFSISEDGRRIRANQGHSIPIKLGLEAMDPPEMLYHGTSEGFIDSIRREGLVKGRRHHVHLSTEVGMAINVGQRHGKPAVLAIDAQTMNSNGHVFYRSTNGVWLTDSVPVRYIKFPSDSVTSEC